MKDFVKRNGIWLGFFALVAVISIASGGSFLSPRNLSNVMRQTSINGILAGGMTLIILTGGIDLSIGSVVALCGILVGISQVHWLWSDAGALGAFGSGILSIVAGTLLGLITGCLIAYLRIVPFVITLGMMVVARGLALIFSDGSAISPMGEAVQVVADAYLPQLATILVVSLLVGLLCGQVYRDVKRGAKTALIDLCFPITTIILLSYAFIGYRGFPLLALILSMVLAALSFLLTRTTLGRAVYAIGSNERAAFWAGVPVARVTVFVYALMGALAGLAGLLLTSRLNGAEPNAGQLFELDAIASVVIGGTSLKGGQGSIMGSFIGALTIASLNNGMDLLGVPSFYQMVFKGVIIIFAVSLDQGQRQRI